MSHEPDQTMPSHDDASSSIKLEPSPFEPGFQPESIPQISVPDIPEDAVGLTAEALANVPTLTEQVEEEVQEQETNPEVPTDEVAIQDAPAQADTGLQQLHARMGKLTDDIQQLNVRLDRLEEKIHIEV